MIIGLMLKSNRSHLWHFEGTHIQISTHNQSNECGFTILISNTVYNVAPCINRAGHS